METTPSPSVFEQDEKISNRIEFSVPSITNDCLEEIIKLYIKYSTENWDDTCCGLVHSFLNIFIKQFESNEDIKKSGTWISSCPISTYPCELLVGISLVSYGRV